MTQPATLRQVSSASDAFWSVCLFLSLATLFAGLLAKESAETRLQAVSKPYLVPARFTIADFDGDQKPDLATVRIDRSDSKTTNYSIHLQLSAGPEAVIGITAPMGGLQIASRDVNGDRYLDLVIRTSLESNLVAVLLNDGHGSFTIADPGAYPGLQKDSDVYNLAAARRLRDRFSLLPPRGVAGAERATASTIRLPIGTELLSWEGNRNYSSFLAESSCGRSPPSFSAAS